MNSNKLLIDYVLENFFSKEDSSKILPFLKSKNKLLFPLKNSDIKEFNVEKLNNKLKKIYLDQNKDYISDKVGIYNTYYLEKYFKTEKLIFKNLRELLEKFNIELWWNKLWINPRLRNKSKNEYFLFHLNDIIYYLENLINIEEKLNINKTGIKEFFSITKTSGANFSLEMPEKNVENIKNELNFYLKERNVQNTSSTILELENSRKNILNDINKNKNVIKRELRTYFLKNFF